MQKIKSSGQHLLGIINDILDFSKIEAGKLTIENIDFDLDKVLENVGNLISEKAAAKGLELIFEVEPAVSAHFRGDPLRLGQILINFCNNAVKFTEKGEVAVEVRVLEDASDSQLSSSRCATPASACPSADRPAVPGLRAGRRLDHPQVRRHRPGPRHLQAAGRADGRDVASTASPARAARSGSPPGSAGAPRRRGRAAPSDCAAGACWWSTTIACARRARRDAGQHELHRRRGGFGRGGARRCARRPSAGSATSGLHRLADAGDRRVRDRQAFCRCPDLDLPPHLVMVTAYGREEVLKQAEDAGFEDVLIKPVTSSSCSTPRWARSAPTVSGGDSAGGRRLRIERLRGARVLLVEDNEINQEVASDSSRMPGCRGGRRERRGGAPHDRGTTTTTSC